MHKPIILQQIIDSSDGVLSIAESEDKIPFKIKRIFDWAEIVIEVESPSDGMELFRNNFILS